MIFYVDENNIFMFWTFNLGFKLSEYTDFSFEATCTFQ